MTGRNLVARLAESNLVTSEVEMPWRLRKKRNPFAIKTVKSIKPIKAIKPIKPIKPIRPIKPIAPIGYEYYWRDK